MVLCRSCLVVVVVLLLLSLRCAAEKRCSSANACCAAVLRSCAWSLRHVARPFAGQLPRGVERDRARSVATMARARASARPLTRRHPLRLASRAAAPALVAKRKTGPISRRRAFSTWHDGVAAHRTDVRRLHQAVNEWRGSCFRRGWHAWCDALLAMRTLRGAAQSWLQRTVRHALNARVSRTSVVGDYRRRLRAANSANAPELREVRRAFNLLGDANELGRRQCAMRDEHEGRGDGEHARAAAAAERGVRRVSQRRLPQRVVHVDREPRAALSRLWCALEPAPPKRAPRIQPAEVPQSHQNVSLTTTERRC